MEKFLHPLKTLAKLAAFSLFMLTVFMACEPEEYPVETTDEVNMTVFFEQHPDQYSKFLQMLETTRASGYLAAYGTYTVFAPSNEAVDAFLAEEGVASVEELESNKLSKIVKFHIIEDTLRTRVFTDGKLPQPTLFGQYIITGAENLDGVSKITVNRQANLTTGNISVGNGIVHDIDQVLRPAEKSLAEMLDSNPEYSIFTMAAKATGFYDSLYKAPVSGPAVGKGWYTVLAQTDEVYAESGIDSFEDLKNKYSHTGDPLNPNDSLHLYMAYRLLGGNKYVADIVGSNAHPTMAPQEVITTKLKGDSVLINEDVFKGVLEKGVPILRAESDNSATNGVLHTVGGDFTLKLRLPFRVYFDVADQPELRTMPTYRVPGSPSVVVNTEEIEGISTEGQSTVEYHTVAVGDGNPRAFYDYLSLNMRIAVTNEITFTTPTIVRGTYKVWIAFRRTAEDGILQVDFNGQALQKPLPYAEYYPGGDEETLVNLGWKRYTTPNTGHSQARLMGTIEVETTTTHEISFKVLVDDHRGQVQLDMIQFIPVDEDQLWPKVAEDGSFVYPED